MRIITDPKEKYQVVNCLETNCLYRKTCANHTSAGDFRSTGGFSPQLMIINGHVHCKTHDVPPYGGELDDIKEWYPSNHNKLDSGSVLWKDLEQSDNYTI